MKLDIMITLLSDPKVFYARIIPLDNPLLSDLVDKLAPDTFISKPLAFFAGSNQAIIITTSDQAKALVGVIANHMTDNGLSQIDNLEFTTNYGIGYSNI